MSKVLVVLSMHRSGSSLTGQWLHKTGLNLGKRLMGAGVGNVNGHYEDLDFHDLHEDILQSNGIGYGGLQQVPELNISESQQQQMRALIEEKNKEYSSWGWKEPRTCLFVDQYESLIDGAYYLMVYRDFDQVVDSLYRRAEKEFEAAYGAEKRKWYHRRKKLKAKRQLRAQFAAAWIQYNEKIVSLAEQLPVSRFKLLHYSDLLDKSDEIIQWLNNEGFDLKSVSFSSVYNQEQIQREAVGVKVSSRLRREVNEIVQRMEELKLR